MSRHVLLTRLMLVIAFAVTALLLPRGSFAAGETGPKVLTWEDGKKMAEGQMVEGKKAGLWTFWGPDGTKEEEVSYGTAGQKDGPYVSYHKNGRRREEGRHEAGAKTGTWTSWREDGTMSSGVTYGIVSSVNAKGKVLKKSVRRGPSVQCHSNGKKSMECVFDDDKKSGPCTEWDRDGIKTTQGAFKSGKRDGTWVEWDGKSRLTGETVYTDGKEIQSSRTRYDLDGRKSSQTTEKQEGGKKTTRETSWDYFASGKLKSEQTTVDGTPDGRWTLWDEQGTVVKSTTYANGIAMPGASAAGSSLLLFQKIVQQKEYDRATLGLTAGKLPRTEQDALAAILIRALIDSPGDQTLAIEKLWLATIDLCPDNPRAAEGYHRLTNLYRTGFAQPKHEKIVKLLEQLFVRYKDDPDLPRQKYTDNPLGFSPVRMLHQSYEELGRFEPIVAYYDEQVKKGTRLINFDCFDYAAALEKTGKGTQAVEWYEKCLAATPDKTSVHAAISKQKIAELKKK